MAHCYTQRSASRSTLIWEPSYFSCWQLTQRPTREQRAESERPWSIRPPMGHLYQTLPLQAQGSTQRRRWEGLKSQSWWLAPRKECLPDTRLTCVRNSQSLWQRAQDLCKSGQTKSQHGETEVATSPTPTQREPTGKGKVGFLQRNVTVHVSHTLGQAPRSGLSDQHKANFTGLLLCVLLLMWLVFYFALFWGEKWHKIGRPWSGE